MTSSESVTHAVIALSPPKGGWRWLLDKPLAGVPALMRLVFAMGRAGIERMVISSHGLDSYRQKQLQELLEADPRCRAKVLVRDLANIDEAQEFLQLKQTDEAVPVLLASGNLVTTTATLQRFLKEKVGTTAPDARAYEPLCLVSSNHLSHIMEKAVSFASLPVTTLTASNDGRGNFVRQIEDHHTFRQLESELIHHHRHHYSQLLDIYFNGHFSIPISSLLVKLPVTPNQVTLFGLVIGAAAGWLFSRGDYVSGLVGGILLAFTAIWDCCDGDVARIKFMESDFGETLDTACDNIINVFIFLGIAFGAAKIHGWGYALTPFLLLALGGFSIFALIYFPKGGKGDFFKGTRIYDLILLLASRNFIYVILAFAIVGRLDWFLWLAGFGSMVFAAVLYFVKRKIRLEEAVHTP